jgi:hypothetical protein
MMLHPLLYSLAHFSKNGDVNENGWFMKINLFKGHGFMSAL